MPRVLCTNFVCENENDFLLMQTVKTKSLCKMRYTFIIFIGKMATKMFNSEAFVQWDI